MGKGKIGKNVVERGVEVEGLERRVKKENRKAEILQ